MKVRRGKKFYFIAGVMAVVTISGVVFLNNFEKSSAGLSKYGQAEVDVTVGNLEFTMNHLVGLNVANAGDTAYDITGATVGDVIGNTTKGAKDDVNGGYQLSYEPEMKDPISPGWKGIFGFEVSNTGNLDSIINLCLGSNFIAPDGTGAADSRSRIKFTVYSGDDLTANLSKVAEGRVGDTTEITLVDGETSTTTKNVTQYGNLLRPGQILSVTGTTATPITPYTLGIDGNTDGKKTACYYVVVLEFVDEPYKDSEGNTHDGWIGNNAGDNTYMLGNLQFSIGVTGVGPTDAKFKYDADAKFGPEAPTEAETPAP